MKLRDYLKESKGEVWRWKPKGKNEKWIAEQLWEWLTVEEQKAERINYSLMDDSTDARSAMMHIADGEYKEAARLLKVYDSDLVKAVLKLK